MDTPLSILERAEREMLLVSQEHHCMCTHWECGVKQRRGEKYGKRGNGVTDRGNKTNGMSKNQF